MHLYRHIAPTSGALLQIRIQSRPKADARVEQQTPCSFILWHCQIPALRCSQRGLAMFTPQAGLRPGFAWRFLYSTPQSVVLPAFLTSGNCLSDVFQPVFERHSLVFIEEPWSLLRCLSCAVHSPHHYRACFCITAPGKTRWDSGAGCSVPYWCPSVSWDQHSAVMTWPSHVSRTCYPVSSRRYSCRACHSWQQALLSSRSGCCALVGEEPGCWSHTCETASWRTTSLTALIKSCRNIARFKFALKSDRSATLCVTV